MGSLSHPLSVTAIPNPLSSHAPSLPAAARLPLPASLSRPLRPPRPHRHLHLHRHRHCHRVSSSDPEAPQETGMEATVQDLRVPDAWLIPSNAIQSFNTSTSVFRKQQPVQTLIHAIIEWRIKQWSSKVLFYWGSTCMESEWLRAALHKWLDDEYCPEDANIEISKVAAHSYYESLISKQTDLGEILLRMARDLETLSFQESFHGPFSSANAAILLITQRMDSVGAL